MPEKPYQKRELDHYFAELNKRLDKQDDSLQSIEVKVKAVDDKVGIQNGRVTKIEQWSNEARKIIEADSTIIESYKLDKAKIVAAYATAAVLIGAIITLSIIVINGKIKEAVDRANVAVAESTAIRILFEKYDKIIINNQ